LFKTSALSTLHEHVGFYQDVKMVHIMKFCFTYSLTTASKMQSLFSNMQ